MPVALTASPFAVVTGRIYVGYGLAGEPLPWAIPAPGAVEFTPLSLTGGGADPVGIPTHHRITAEISQSDATFSALLWEGLWRVEAVGLPAATITVTAGVDADLSTLVTLPTLEPTTETVPVVESLVKTVIADGPIAKGAPVTFSRITGGNIRVVSLVGTALAPDQVWQYVGGADRTAVAGDTLQIIREGTLTKVDTGTLTDEAPFYLDITTGQYTSTPPATVVHAGVVLASGKNGTLHYRIAAI